MKFKIMCREGDAAYDYDLATAEVKFNELIKERMLPVVVSENRVLKRFEPDVDEVTWMPSIMGG